MPTNYTIEGSIQLTGVSFSGGEGLEGSTLSWTGLTTYIGAWDSDDDRAIQDVNDNGVLDAGLDFLSVSSADFTGYTITVGGEDYPVFYEALFGRYTVALPQNGSVQTIIPSSGTSNVFQAQAAGTYLCFAAGTRIATPDGPRPVEALAPGDAILTAEGRVVPVRFNFRQTVSTRFGPAERLRPVRVRAGALGCGLPLRDLVLTADHALMIDGLLITAGALINGGSIDRVPLAELGARFTVYHIETEAHDVILAEGAAAESFIDYAGRQAFDNYAEYVALYGAARAIAEQPAPRIACARLLPPALKARLGIAQAA